LPLPSASGLCKMKMLSIQVSFLFFVHNRVGGGDFRYSGGGDAGWKWRVPHIFLFSVCWKLCPHEDRTHGRVYYDTQLLHVNHSVVPPHWGAQGTCEAPPPPPHSVYGTSLASCPVWRTGFKGAASGNIAREWGIQ
jgi:hypothetical protein